MSMIPKSKVYLKYTSKSLLIPSLCLEVTIFIIFVFGLFFVFLFKVIRKHADYMCISSPYGKGNSAIFASLMLYSYIPFATYQVLFCFLNNTS